MADITITAANVVPSAAAITTRGVAGETIAAGELVYRSSTTQYFNKADGNDATKLPVVGLAINSASAGQPISILESDPNLVIGTHGVGVGVALYASPTAGKICPVADIATGNYTTVVMVARSATAVSFGILGGAAAFP